MDATTDVGWIHWGGDRMFVVDYTPAGFPIGLREEEIEELEWLEWLDTLEPPDTEGR